MPYPIPVCGRLPCARLGRASSCPHAQLACDMVRFICGFYHPPNAILASNVVQRYAMLGWLMQLMRVRIRLH